MGGRGIGAGFGCCMMAVLKGLVAAAADCQGSTVEDRRRRTAGMGSRTMIDAGRKFDLVAEKRAVCFGWSGEDRMMECIGLAMAQSALAVVVVAVAGYRNVFAACRRVGFLEADQGS